MACKFKMRHKMNLIENFISQKYAYLPLTWTDEAFIDKALVFLIFWFKMLWIFFFLTALCSAKGNWNTIMTSAFTPSSSGLWDTRERWLFKEYIWCHPTLFPVFSSPELCLSCWEWQALILSHSLSHMSLSDPTPFHMFPLQVFIMFWEHFSH